MKSIYYGFYLKMFFLFLLELSLVFYVWNFNIKEVKLGRLL